MDVLTVERHPGWTYVPGSLAEQPQHLLNLEMALAEARQWHASVKRAPEPEGQ